MQPWLNPHFERARQRNFMLPACPCCSGATILVLCHWPATWSVLGSLGTITRIDPSDGSAMWTTDLGAHSVSGEKKRALSARIDSDGAIYCYYDSPPATGITSWWDSASTGDCGGIAKLDYTDGSVTWDTEFGSKSASYSTSSERYKAPNVAIASSSVWVTHIIEGAGNDYLKEIRKSDGAILQAFGYSDLTLPSWSTTPNTENFDPRQWASVEVAGDGDLFVRCLRTSSAWWFWFKMDTSGNVSWVSQLDTGDSDYPSYHLTRGDLVPDSSGSGYWMASTGNIGSDPTTAAKPHIVYKGAPSSDRALTITYDAPYLSEWVSDGMGGWMLPTDVREIVDLTTAGNYSAFQGWHNLVVYDDGSVIVIPRSARSYAKKAGGSENHQSWHFGDTTLDRNSPVTISKTVSGDHPTWAFHAVRDSSNNLYVAGLDGTSWTRTLTKWPQTYNTGATWKVENVSSTYSYSSKYVATWVDIRTI